MTNAELIKRLSKLDPDARVLVLGYEGGYEDIDPDLDIQETHIALNVRKKSLMGPHDDADVYSSDEWATCRGIILG